MAKITAQEIREQARKLLEKAKKIENERATKIGKIVIKYEADNFKNFDLEAFKKQIANI